MSALSRAARGWLADHRARGGATVAVVQVGIAASRRTAVAHHVADAAEITIAGETTLAASWLCGGSTVDGYAIDDNTVDCVGCRLAAAVPAGPVVYSAWGDDDALLYVGSTINAAQRIRQHSRATRWWPEVRRLTFEQFATEHEVRRAELRAINERPGVYNREGRPGRFSGPAKLLKLVEESA